MRLPKVLRGAPAESRRRRRTPRADAPRTIIPVEPRESAAPPSSPFDVRLDAARERLRHAIPPVDDEG